MRVLPYIRLSDYEPTTTSPERQLEDIRREAERRGDALLAPVIDLDVSGGKPLFADRRGRRHRALTDWLEEADKLAQYDVIMTAKLDRLSRSLADILRLLEWAERNGKRYVSVAEHLDPTTATGKMMIQALGMLAEFERSRTSERRREAAAYLRREGLWNGGNGVPYGFAPARHGNHWKLEPEPAQAAVVRRMATAIVDEDRSAAAVARMLNADQVPTAAQLRRKADSTRPAPRGAWTTGVVLAILRNPLMVEILGSDRWQAVTKVIGSEARKHSGRWPTALLAGIATCGNCGAKLYGSSARAVDIRDPQTGKLGRTYSYYRCQGRCGLPMIPQADLDADVADALLEQYGEEFIPERIDVPASDATAKLEDVTARINDLSAEFRAGRLPARLYSEQVSILEADREQWAAEPYVPAHVEYKPTKVKFRDRWAELDKPGRTALLRDLRASVQRGIDPERRETWTYVVLGSIDEFRAATARAAAL